MKSLLKKSLSVVLAITIIFSSALVGLGEVDFGGSFAIKAEAASVSDLTFTLSNDGKSYSVTRCNQSASGSLVIPGIYNGIPVKSIGRRAFFNCRKLTSIDIPFGVTSIDDYAFTDCTSLTSLIIPDSVEFIGYSAFDNTGYYNNDDNWENDVLYICSQLVKAKTSLSGEYKIKSGTKTISRSAFSDCTGLTKIEIPYGVLCIENSSFKGCTSLESINIPDSVISIGDYAFSDCNSLVSINIPKGVAAIGWETFSDCTSLTEIKIPDGVTNIGNSAFDGCVELAKVEMPDNLKFVCDFAFRDCKSLTEIDIPYGAVSIGRSAFNGCERLTTMKIPDTVGHIGKYAFDGCANLTEIKIPAGITNIDDGMFWGCERLTTVEIPDSITVIGDNAFYNCISLDAIDIPDGLISIGDYAFDNCSSLDTIDIPDGVTNIGGSAFSYTGYYSDYSNWEDSVLYIGKHLVDARSDLPSQYKIKEGTKTIAASAFEYCSRLTSIEIPDSVTYIGKNAFYNTGYYNDTNNWINDVLYIGNHLIKAKTTLSGKYIAKSGTRTIAGYAFENCSNLTSIELSDSLAGIGEYAFYYCSNLTSVGSFSGITSIGDYAFYRCSNLTTFKISAGLKHIGEYAFYSCGKLPALTIPDGVISIGEWAFSGCSSLKSIEIPDSAKSIGENAFRECANLTSVVIGKGITSLSESTFDTCSALASVTLPEGLKHIGNLAFYYCQKLRSISFPGGLKSIGRSAFYLCESLESILIPASVTSIDRQAFIYCSSITSITIPDGVTNIDVRAFSGCEGLEEITIPYSVKNIELSAFESCPSLKNIYYKGTLSQWDNVNIATGNVCLEIAPISHICTPSNKWIVDVDSTCIATGSKHRSCVACGKIMEVAEVPAKGHVASEWKIRTDSTCTEPGLKYKDCTACGVEIETGVIPAKGHNEVSDPAKEPTCTETGLTIGSHCSVCNAVIIAQSIIPERGHISSAWIVDKKATCTEKGSKYKECTICGVTLETDVISAKGHTEVTDKAIAPTCTTTGKTEGSHCSVCSVVIKAQEIVPANGHLESAWIIDKNATCTEKGSKHIECTVCNAIIKTVAIPATGHTEVKDSAVDPTCTKTGLTEGGHCSVCNAVIKAQVVIPAKGHTKSAWIIDENATCTTDGAKHIECTVCGITLETQTILATGHTKSDWIIDVAPVCTAAGSKHIECVNCGLIFDSAILLATGHTAVIDAAVEPTCTETGLTEGSHCSVCNLVIKVQAVVPATSHELSGWIVKRAATCTRVGSKYKICEVCGEIVKRADIPMTDHTESDWITDTNATVYKAGSKHKECTICGEELETAKIPQLKCAKPVLKKVYNANDYVKVTWGAVKGADLYRVYRKTGTGEYEYIGSTTHAYFNDKEAGAGKTCRYIVKAKNEAGNSEASASIAIKHVDEPTLKSIENSAYGVLIKWDKVTGAEKYNVYRKVSGGEYEYIGETDKTYYTDKTAESGTKYYYAIRGKRVDSVSSQSASLSKYYLEDPTLNTPTSTSEGIGLRWSEVNGAEGYMVYRKTADGSYKRITTEEGISNVTFRDTTAEKGNEYTYKIKAYYSKTYSAYSNTKAITDKY